MDKRKIYKVTTTSVTETEELAERLGAKLRGGECIELISDLGGGKTSFTRGLARGAGSNDEVASPTFTVSRVYKTKFFTIHHFDFYRLQEAGLAAFELHDLLRDPEIVIVVEWAQVVSEVLPAERLSITIRQTDENKRQFDIAYPAKLSYIIEEIL